MRALHSLLLVASAATTLQGQRIGPDRFSRSRAFVPVLTADGTGTSDAPRNALGAPPAAPMVEGQLLAGVGGWVVGLLAGGLVGRATAGESDGLAAGAEVAILALAGASLGSAIGVQWHGKRHGLRSPFLGTLAGSVLGMVPIIVSPLTSPLGATLAYNHFRRDRTEP
jgi:hypothetical protein